MKALLIASTILACASIFLILHNGQEANAIPFVYNTTQLTVPFTTFTINTTSGALPVLVEGGYNGTVTAHYTGHTDNAKITYDFGYHPTLPLSVDGKGNLTVSAVTTATQKLNVTVASGNNNRVLVVGVVFKHVGDTNHNNARMSNLKIDSLSPFTLISNKTVTCGNNVCDAEMWYFIDPPTGFNTIVITPASVSTYHMIAGVYSLYNVRHLAVVGTNNTNTATNTTASSTATPTYTGSSLLIQNIFSNQTASPTGPTDTLGWVGKGTLISGISQYKSAPTINGINTMKVTTSSSLWLTNVVEITPIQDQTTFNYYISLTPHTTSTTALNLGVNGSNVYYAQRLSGSGNYFVNHLNVDTGIETHDFTSTTDGGVRQGQVFLMNKNGMKYISQAGASSFATSAATGNTSAGTIGVTPTITNQFLNGGIVAWYNTNGTATDTARGTPTVAYVTYTPTNKTTPIDSIVSAVSIPAHVYKYWNGLMVQGTGNYYSNSTLNLLSTIIASAYKVPLTIPSVIYNIPDTDVRMLGHWSGIDYFVSQTTTKITYTPMSTINTQLSYNKAEQVYMTTDQNVDSQYHLEPSSINPSVPISFYGPALNTTISKYGMITLISGYTMRTTNQASSIRNIDPQWSNTPSNNYPTLTTSGSLFPILLTVSNAPIDAGMIASDGNQIIGGISGAWSITKLDSAHTVEFDIPSNQCANIYVADITMKPPVYTYQGNVCATGVSQKTVAYTNTLPLTFYTMKYGATSSYNPTTNGLAITVRANSAPFTYNVVIKNSTGTVKQNFTQQSNGTTITHNFNVSSTEKPGSVFVSIPGTGLIYSTYMGSALSLASVASFFHQYFSYQGFDLLSFIPVIFAAMFTRNTVGIGMAMTVVLVATLSFLSIVVVSDTVIAIMIFISAIGMIGYRSLYG